MNATGGVAPYTVTDPVTGEVRPVELEGPGAEHRALPLRRGRGPLHPHLRPAGLADVGVGPRRRRTDERPADRDAASTTSSRSRSRARTACPRRRATRTARAATCPPRIQADIETLARQSVEDGTYASYGEALFNLDLASGAYSCARCHTKGWSYGDPGVPGQGAFGWNLTGGNTTAKFPEHEDDDRVRRRRARRTAPATRRSRRAAAGCPASGTLLTDEQLEAIVEYVRSL